MSKERAQTFHTYQVSLWNFCGRSSDFNSQGYQGWSGKMSAIFTDYFVLRFFLFSWDRLRLLFFNWNLKKILKIVIIFAEISGSLTHSVPGCPCSKTSSPQCSPQLSRSSLFSGPSRRGAGVMYTGDTSMRVHECCCCCCNEDLLKLQVTGLVLCLRCWTTWRQKQKGEELKKMPDRFLVMFISPKVITILDSVCDLEVCFFLANTSAVSMKSNQKSLPRATIGSCVMRKREK